MTDRLRAVIFDWRGTLVLAPTFRGWVTEALRRIAGLPVDSFVLPFEHGVVKPDPAAFRIAPDELGTEPAETLMVGGRAG